MTKAQQIIHEFSLLCGSLFIDIHIALENPRVRQQLAIKEPVENKVKSLRFILESEF